MWGWAESPSKFMRKGGAMPFLFNPTTAPVAAGILIGIALYKALK